MKIMWISLFCIFIVGCKSDEQIKSEKFIYSVISQDWSIEVPFDGLVEVHKDCKEHQEYKGCEQFFEQLYDISISYNSCQKSFTSKLCNSVIKEISNHSILSFLPETDPLDLPSDPFYISLPTKLLESKASVFSYREEVLETWINDKKILFIMTLFILLVGLCVNEYTKFKESEAQKLIQIHQLEAEREKLIEKEMAEQVIKLNHEKAARLQAEESIRIARQLQIDEYNRLLNQEKVAKEESERQAEEKAEAEAILEAITNRKRKGK